MFAINYFGNKKRTIDNVEDERNEMGSQSRIYDYNTGIYARILPSSDGRYSLAEAGRASAGIFYDLYGFEGLFDDDFDLSSIETDIDNLGSISTEEVNFIIQHGFLEFLMQKGTRLTSEDGFKTILKAERILKSIEDSGKLTYDDVLQELQKRLEAKDLSEEDKKIIEQIQDVYTNTMFSQIRQGREFNTLVEERQRKQNGQHTAQEISDDLHEIARIGSKEDALHELVETKEKGQNTTYNILGVGPISKESIIYCIENNAMPLQNFLDVIREDEDIRQVALKKLAKMSQEDIQFWGYEHILADIQESQKSSVERN